MAPKRMRPENPLSHHMVEASEWLKGQRRKGPLTEASFKEWLNDHKSPKARLQILGQLEREKGSFERSVPRMEALRSVPARELPELWSLAGSMLMQNTPPALVVPEIANRLVDSAGMGPAEARAAARHIVADAREHVPQRERKKGPVLAEILKRKRRL